MSRRLRDGTLLDTIPPESPLSNSSMPHFGDDGFQHLWDGRVTSVLRLLEHSASHIRNEKN
ncbi:hypothetical protein E4U59_001139, partial [Claviceps monticola]